jgi:hypothetical protein
MNFSVFFSRGSEAWIVGRNLDSYPLARNRCMTNFRKSNCYFRALKNIVEEK